MTRIIALSLAVLLALTTDLNGQTLARKGFLGIQFSLNEDNSMEVLQVFENSTAAAIGLQAGDKIGKLDGQTFASIPEFIELIASKRAGEPIEVDFLRGGERIHKVGEIVGRPLEQSEHGKVIYGEVAYDGGLLRSILELPHGVQDPPVLLFLPGIGCASYDFGMDPQHTVKLLVESVVAEGVAVFRVEKPGMGDSKGTLDCLEMDYNYEVGAFKAALETLKQTDGIDPSSIFLYGESLSTISAPLVAEGHEIAGIINWGGISKTWFEYYMDLLRKQNVLLGADYADIDTGFREKQAFYFDFLVRQMDPEQLAEKPEYKELAAANFKGQSWKGLHHYTFFHVLNQVDILSAYKATDCPVFCLAGEFDIHTANSDWAREITAAVNYYRPGTATYAMVPGTTHHYFKVESLAAYNELRQSGTLDRAYEIENFNYKIGAMIASWIDAII